MKITDVIKVVDGSIRSGALEDFEVSGICAHSLNARDNCVFVAVKGSCADGRAYIREAVARGARVVVLEEAQAPVQDIPHTPVITVADARKALGRLTAEFFGNPSRAINVVGITGTNGKTTITYLLEAIIKEARRSPGVIGTINYRFKDTVIPASNTTPAPADIQHLLARMREAGVDIAVMEVSSHALDQDRTEGIHFHSAIFTNLTHDHLDYHRTIDNYFSSKAKLFRNLAPGACAVFNNDDAWAMRLKQLTGARVITYGIDTSADVMANDIRGDCGGMQFAVSSPYGNFIVHSRLIGRHNVYNMLAASAWSLRAGIDMRCVAAALEKFLPVPGRLQRIDAGQPFCVFVDYAHTQDALKNVLQTLRSLSRGRIITVFGCGGDRDRSKRPKMGRTASEMSDEVIITSDNPRSEEPSAIIRDILAGGAGGNCAVIPDRREAIAQALGIARDGDIVLVAGKGHETHQIFGDTAFHFDDREEILACLHSMKR